MGRTGDRKVGRTVGRTVGRNVGRTGGRTGGRTVGRNVGRNVGRTVGRTVGMCRWDPVFVAEVKLIHLTRSSIIYFTFPGFPCSELADRSANSIFIGKSRTLPSAPTLVPKFSSHLVFLDRSISSYPPCIYLGVSSCLKLMGWGITPRTKCVPTKAVMCFGWQS